MGLYWVGKKADMMVDLTVYQSVGHWELQKVDN